MDACTNLGVKIQSNIEQVGRDLASLVAMKQKELDILAKVVPLLSSVTIPESLSRTQLYCYHYHNNVDLINLFFPWDPEQMGIFIDEVRALGWVIDHEVPPTAASPQASVYFSPKDGIEIQATWDAAAAGSHCTLVETGSRVVERRVPEYRIDCDLLK